MPTMSSRLCRILALASLLVALTGHAGESTGIPYTPGLDIAAMDPSVDPCNDFYEYACGGWRKNNPIPADQSGWSVYAKLHQDNLGFLRGILESASQPSASRGESMQKIGDFYGACMDVAGIDRAGQVPVMPVLERIAQGAKRSGWAALLAEIHLVRGSAFFRLEASQDFSEASAVITFLAAGGLGLPDRDYYIAADAHSVALRTAYVDHVTRLFSLAGESPQAAGRDALTVLRIETRLARASLTRVALRDPQKLNHRMTGAALHRLAPHFDWVAYLTDRGLGDVAVVNVTEPEYLREFDRILVSEPSSVLSTYLRWHALHDASPHLSGAFRHENFAFYSKTLRGQAEEKARWKTCVTMVDRQLGDALGREFIAKAFSSEQKQATLRMTRQIEAEMRKDIESLPWMSAGTKHEAVTKLDSIVNKIGYPDRWRDYTNLDIRPGDYFGNLQRASAFEVQRHVAKIGRPLDRAEWMMTPPTVNAYYDPQMNDINFPAGVLQPPLYDAAMDDAPNYGDTGGTIGHELTHGFDDEGRQFDAKGNLRDWWSAADAKAFETRTQCIVDQYAQYVVVDDLHINSHLTIGEDAADLGGLILAYNAWKSETENKTLTSREGMTPDQRFFVGYAQWACENSRPESERLQVRTDPHSPGRYRVNGLVVNMPEFERAFACHKGDAMVRENRCRVW